MASRDDVYKKFGITAEAAQLFETSLGTILLAAKGMKEDWHLQPHQKKARVVLDSIQQSTLGILLKTVQQHVTFEDDVTETFCVALKTRNRLMHGFFEGHNFKIQTGNGRDEMLADLEIMHEVLFAAWQTADRISSAFIEALLHDAVTKV